MQRRGDESDVIASSLQELPVRHALAGVLREEGYQRLASSGRLWESNRNVAFHEMQLSKGYEHAALAIEFGAAAVELLGVRYYLAKAEVEITTPKERDT
jgi:hypothetical protein